MSKSLGLITVVVVCCMPLFVQGQTIIFQDDFESYSEDSTLSGQGGWMLDPVNWGTNDAVVGTANGRYDWNASKGIRVNDFTAGPDSSYMIHAIPTQTGGLVQFDLNALIGSRADNRARLFVVDDSLPPTQGAQIDLNGTGTEIRMGGLADTPVNSGWWYQLRLVFDLDVDTVTGSYKRDDQPTYTEIGTTALNPGFTMGKFVLEVRQNGDPALNSSQAAGYIDDIVVTIIPEPGALGLLVLGALFVAPWRRGRMRV